MSDAAGILSIDKPINLTSHDVVNQVRRIVGTRRVGHAGTLDPLATGVLVVGVGRATRLLEYVVGRPKRYEAQVYFGRVTTTYDAEGDVVAEKPVGFDRETLMRALDRFRGEITQIPPMYSAIKHQGVSLYELARQGKEAVRVPRPVTVYELHLLRWNEPVATLEVVCSAGTYVRSLAHDLGELLGAGAFLSALRRTAVGNFTLAEATPLESLSPDNWRQHLLPPDSAVAHLPRLEVDESGATRLALGQRISVRPGEPEVASVRVYQAVGAFVGIAAMDGEQWRPKKIWVQ